MERMEFLIRIERFASRRLSWAAWALLFFCAASAGAATPAGCLRVELRGEAQAGREWKASLGEGWVFRVLPIRPDRGPAGQKYSGWDLVVDREQPAGYPDALLLATPPYDSISEREIGTTFGLRAQDAIGWNPRSFRFLTSAAALGQGQTLLQSIHATGGDPRRPSAATAQARALEQLAALNRKAAAGEFRILDARLVPGVGDAAPFAQEWALASARTPHTLEPAADGKSTLRGEMRWMRFSITLRLPEGWRVPAGLPARRTGCAP